MVVRRDGKRKILYLDIGRRENVHSHLHSIEEEYEERSVLRLGR